MENNSVLARDVKAGIAVMLDGKPCRIINDVKMVRSLISDSTEKHDPLVFLKGEDVLTNSIVTKSVPSSTVLPFFPTTRYNIMDFASDGFLILISEDAAEERCDVRADPSSTPGKTIAAELDGGADLIANVAKMIDGVDIVASVEVFKDEEIDVFAIEQEKAAQSEIIMKDELRALSKELTIAVVKGDVETTRKILDSGRIGVDIKVSYDGWAPLNLALYEGKDEMVTLLLDYNPSVHERTKDQATSLHLAVDKGISLTNLERILKFPGIDVNAVDHQGWTPLHIAANNGRYLQVKHLIDKAEVNTNALTIGGWNPLHAAANGGHAKVCLFLLASGADANARNIENLTPLGQAEKAEKPQLSRVFGYPLHVAVDMDDADLILRLLNKGYQPEQSDEIGKKPADYLRSDLSRRVLQTHA